MVRGNASHTPLELVYSKSGDHPLYCIHCGQPRPFDAAFCPHCGRALDIAQPPPPAAAGLQGSRIPLVPWRGGQVAYGILLVLVSIVPVTLLATALGSLAGRYDVALSVWTSSHLMGLSILVVVWALGLRRYRVNLSALGLGAPRMPHTLWPLVSLGVMVASLVATIIYSAIVSFVPTDILLPPEIPGEIAFPGPAAAATFQALAVWTPLTEEIFFRGFIFAGLAPRLGPWRAMLVSALVFSLFHLTLGLLVPVFITGFLLAWLYRQTGSIWPSILAHAGQNTLAVLATLYWV